MRTLFLNKGSEQYDLWTKNGERKLPFVTSQAIFKDRIEVKRFPLRVVRDNVLNRFIYREKKVSGKQSVNKKWSEKYYCWIEKCKVPFVLKHSLMRGYPCPYYKLDKWVSIFGIEIKFLKRFNY